MGQGQVKLEEHVVAPAGRVCDHRYRDGESVCGKRHRKERHIPALAGLHPRWPRKRYELIAIVEQYGLEYVQTHFRYTLLEHYDFTVPKDVVLTRESYWKEALDTRKHGYNDN